MAYGDLPTIKSADGTRSIQGFPVAVINPPKTALLRLPSDQEVIDRVSKETTLQKELGRGQSKYTPVPMFDVNLDLFNRLRIDKGEVGEEFDQWEATDAINRL